MTPSDVAAVRLYIDSMDVEGAAREFALRSGIGAEGTLVLAQILHEAIQSGRHEATVKWGKEWSEEDWS